MSSGVGSLRSCIVPPKRSKATFDEDEESTAAVRRNYAALFRNVVLPAEATY